MAGKPAPEAIDTAARHTFDLATEIPLRARLFRVAEDEHVLVGVAHHIAADGWSITPLVADLGVAYASRCAGQAPGWAPLAVQYVDYTLWQRAQFGDLADSQSRIAAQLAYWEQALAGMPERLELPTDRPYPPIADYRGARVAVDWPAELQQQVARVAREHNATSFMVMQAALAVLLAKLSASPKWRWGSRSPGAAIPRWMSWWVFSSTPWCCGSTWPEIPALPSCWPRCGGAAWPHTSTKMCPLRCWWSGSTRLEASPSTRSCRRCWPAEPPLAGKDPAAGLTLGDLQATQLPVDTQTARMTWCFPSPNAG